MDLGIKDKRALVFASSQGLGKAIAAELCREGAKVLLCSRNEEHLQQAAEEIGAAGYVVGDLGIAGDATRIVQEAIGTLGGIDILVTNAGGPPKGLFADLSLEQWQSAYQSLFMAVVEAVHAVLPGMEKSGWGRILFVTSIAGKEPIPKLTTSNALRAGVHGLMNTLSKELGSTGITVNALLPSYTNTARLKELGRDLSELAETIPVGRLGEPEELGKYAAFICSEHTGFVTGQAIGFDGGTMAGQ